MTAKGNFLHHAVLLALLIAMALHSGASQTPDPGTPRHFSPATLAKVVPGQTTKTQVEALLGKPWRTFQPEPGESGPEIWEYRGKDSHGTYRVHIEFGDRNVATLISNIPDKTGEAPARVAETPPVPNKAHK